MDIAFDLISDLNLAQDEVFSWEGKATSLYCIIAGNISKHPKMVHQVLWHLTKFYQGIFFVGGELEYSASDDIQHSIKVLDAAGASIRGVAHLHNHVVILDGVAILGATGWYGPGQMLDSEEDCIYLNQAIHRLQLHRDVKKIVVVTNAVPRTELYFGEEAEIDLPLSVCLSADSERKISHWVYGQHNRNAEVAIDGITYINNSSCGQTTYWPKRFKVID